MYVVQQCGLMITMTIIAIKIIIKTKKCKNVLDNLSRPKIKVCFNDF